MSNIQIFLVLFVPYILLANYVANFFDEIAEEKGYKSFYSLCIVLPVIGWILILALPDRHGNEIDLSERVLKKKLSFKG